MRMGNNWKTQRTAVGLGLCLALVLTCFLVGCGGKKEPVETDVTTSPEPEAPEVVPESPTPEPEETTQAIPQVDYAAMDPVAYGIEDVFFDFDVFELSNAAMSTLAANARIMREHSDLVWLIEGHCDERGTVEYNLALGEKRAKKVREYLTSLGVPARQLQFTSYGEERPFALGHDESAWELNRRAHFARP